MTNNNENLLPSGCAESQRFRASRRSVLLGASGVMGGLVTTTVFGGAFREVAYGASGDTIVLLNMGGGVDGLSWVVPHAEPAYYAARPNIAVPKSALLGADATFGLNPAMAPLMGMWAAGKVGMLHAAGLGAPNRSHFSAGEAVGDADPGSSVRRGWVNRMVGLTELQSQFEAIGLSPGMPGSMVGPESVMSMSGIDSASVPGAASGDTSVKADRRRAQLATMFGAEPDQLSRSVNTSVLASTTLQGVASASYTPANDADYPISDIGRALRDTARLVKSGVGVRVVAIDYGAFDHHVDVGAVSGSLFGQIRELARAVAAFFTDLGQQGDRVTLVTTSEFGRRLEQNGSAGIDHGWGNVMMAVGGDVVGGYHASWPGLSQDRLQDGDVKVTTDFRQLLADVVQRRVPEVSVAQVFPGLTRASTGVIA